MRIFLQATVALAMLAASLPSAAGSAATNFSTMITLLKPGATSQTVTAGGGANDSGFCISRSLSEQTGAVVTVVCETGQFVSISGEPGARFVGKHGGAYGYYFGPAFGSVSRSEYNAAGMGAGTITSFRVYSIQGADGPLDLLVSF